ncbi:MAG: phosphohydrolase [Bacteroidales bacterium]|nr:phosphohydrolase [Bacteroidales bacterium]
MNLDAARDYILKRMASELSPHLHYHSIDHTFDVHHACLELARIEGVNGSDLALLETAAFFHDSGIIETYENHEEASVKIAREILPEFGYTEDEMKIIECIILKTKLPQSAITLLGEILCDSDLDYLGRPDFFMIAQRLRYEWELMGNRYGLREWYEMQLRFLGNHKYYTRAARLLRDEGKRKNLTEIERTLGK